MTAHGRPVDENMVVLQEFSLIHMRIHRCGRPRSSCAIGQRRTRKTSSFRALLLRPHCGKLGSRWVVYTRDSPHPTTANNDETHLSTERPTPQTASWVPSANVLARRARDPQAAPRAGPQAPLGLRLCSAATGSPGRETSTPSTGAGALPRVATSCSTGSRAPRMPTVSPGSGSLCLARSARRWRGTG